MRQKTGMEARQIVDGLEPDDALGRSKGLGNDRMRAVEWHAAGVGQTTQHIAVVVLARLTGVTGAGLRCRRADRGRTQWVR